jgi:hypothetical protein
MKKTSAIIGIVLGILFAALAIAYWSIPAGSLPSFMPGFQAGASTIHFKHGLASFILAVAAFIYAWFMSGKKAAQ